MVNSKIKSNIRSKVVEEKKSGSVYDAYNKFIRNLNKKAGSIKYGNDEFYKKEARRTYVKTKKAAELVKKYDVPISEFKKILSILDKLATLKVNKKLSKSELNRVNMTYNNMIKRLVEEGKIKKRTN